MKYEYYYEQRNNTIIMEYYKTENPNFINKYIDKITNLFR